VSTALKSATHYYYDDGALKYAGRVGTGFDEAELDRLGGLLAGLAQQESPFEGRQPPRETHFVDPVLVATVGYGEWTQTRTLRGRIIPAVFLELTYHLEHHLYPQVPSHNLPELARRLDPYLSAAGVRPVAVP